MTIVLCMANPTLDLFRGTGQNTVLTRLSSF